MAEGLLEEILNKFNNRGWDLYSNDPSSFGRGAATELQIGMDYIIAPKDHQNPELLSAGTLIGCLEQPKISYNSRDYEFFAIKIRASGIILTGTELMLTNQELYDALDSLNQCIPQEI